MQNPASTYADIGACFVLFIGVMARIMFMKFRAMVIKMLVFMNLSHNGKPAGFLVAGCLILILMFPFHAFLILMGGVGAYATFVYAREKQAIPALIGALVALVPIAYGMHEYMGDGRSGQPSFAQESDQRADYWRHHGAHTRNN